MTMRSQPQTPPTDPPSTPPAGILSTHATSIASIALLTPYRAQLAALRSALASEPRAQSDAAAARVALDVSTVDGFQGREADVVIVTCVRAQAGGAAAQSDRGSSQYSRIGFLADVRRMNVVLTRARRAMWVVCHAATLAGSEEWRPLLEHAAARGVLLEARAPYGRVATGRSVARAAAVAKALVESGRAAEAAEAAGAAAAEEAEAGAAGARGSRGVADGVGCAGGRRDGAAVLAGQRSSSLEGAERLAATSGQQQQQDEAAVTGGGTKRPAEPVAAAPTAQQRPAPSQSAPLSHRRVQPLALPATQRRATAPQPVRVAVGKRPQQPQQDKGVDGRG